MKLLQKPYESARKCSEAKLVQHIETIIPKTHVTHSKWFTYDDDSGLWLERLADDFKPVILQCINENDRTSTLANNVIAHLAARWRSDQRFWSAIRPDTNDPLHVVHIKVKNGVLRVSKDSIELRPHSPDDYFTKSLVVPYVPGLRHPLFEEARKASLPDPDDDNLFQMLVANLGIPDARFEVTGILYGPAGTGKDSIMAPIVAIFGPPENELITNLSFIQLCDPKSYALPKIQYACGNISTELNSMEVQDSAIYKDLVSGNPVPVREIYSRPYSMRTHCKIIALSNYIPRFSNGTDAEIRRMRFLRFDRKPETLDVTFKERLRKPHSGTLNYFLEGLQKLLALGNKAIPHGGIRSRETHARFEASNDPAGIFVTRYCTIDPTVQVPKEDFRKAFESFSEENDLNSKFLPFAIKRVKERFPSINEQRLRMPDGSRERVLIGICLNSEGLKLLPDPSNQTIDLPASVQAPIPLQLPTSTLTTVSLKS